MGSDDDLMDVELQQALALSVQEFEWRVVPMPKNGRCLFGCIGFELLEGTEQRHWVNQSRSASNYAINSDGSIDSYRDDYEVQAAKKTVQKYLEGLLQTRPQYAEHLKAGGIPDEGASSLEARVIGQWSL